MPVRPLPVRHRLSLVLLVAGATLATLMAEPAAAQGGAEDPDVTVRSRPENVVFGGFPIGNAPVATVRSGQTVRIDTISQTGATNAVLNPVDYFGQFGVQPSEVLRDVSDFWTSIPTRPRYGGHVLTGPVYVEGAEPGDTLEVEILDIENRVDYGLNNTTATSGVMSLTYPGWRAGDLGLIDIPEAPLDAKAPGLLPGVRQHLYRTREVRGREVALFSDDIHVPLGQFMGIMAVAPEAGKFVGPTPDAPPPVTGVQNSTPPGPFGGNLDTHDFGAGSTLYLPVFQPGAQSFTGDPHSAQGDGEVSGTAIEHSLRGTFRFTVHKKSTGTPWGEDAENYILMGIDHDLDRAMKLATHEVVRFLVEEKGLTTARAYSLASIAVDFNAAEVVDQTQVISAHIPKSLFGAGGIDRRR